MYGADQRNLTWKPSDGKIVTGLQLLSVVISSDQWDDRNYMADETTEGYFKIFSRNVWEIYVPIYPDRWLTEEALSDIEE